MLLFLVVIGMIIGIINFIKEIKNFIRILKGDIREEDFEDFILK